MRRILSNPQKFELLPGLSMEAISPSTMTRSASSSNLCDGSMIRPLRIIRGLDCLLTGFYLMVSQNCSNTAMRIATPFSTCVSTRLLGP